MKKIFIAVIMGTVVLSLAGKAGANPFNVFGMESESTAMGGAYTALAHGVEATYFNPAGLTEGDYIDGIFGYSYGNPTINIKMADGGSGALMDSAKTPPSAQGYLVGFSIPPLPALKKIAFGISTYIPNKRLVQEIFGDKEGPFVLDYQRETNHLMVIPAIAYEIVPMFSLGIGAMMGANLEIINTPGNTMVGNIDGALKGWAAPEAGILVKPLDKLKIGLAFRGKYSFDNYTVMNILGQDIIMKGTTLYSPAQVALGVGYTYDKIRADIDIMYSFWDDYKPPFTDAVLGGSGITISSFKNPDFSNTITPRVGVEYNLTDIVALRAGYYFKPSPVPEQTSDSNIIDNDTHVGSLGVGLRIPVPTFDNPIKLDLHVQYQQLVKRSTEKDPSVASTNPGYPGYSVTGYAVAGGANLTLAFY